MRPCHSNSRLSAFFASILLCFFIFVVLYGGATAAQGNNGTGRTIGAIVDTKTRSGKEEKIAMEIAIQDLNNKSTISKLSLRIRESASDPLQAIASAENLANEGQARAIVGIQTWQEATLLAGIGKRKQVPVISLASPSVPPPMMSTRWPFLINMVHNYSAEIRCVAQIIAKYQWRKIIAISEDNAYVADTGTIALLSESLKDVRTEIEYHSVFPPFASLSDPTVTIREEFEKMKSKQSRVFVVLQSSLPLAARLFAEAKQLRLMEKDSVWIITDSISSLIASFNSSVFSTMQGVIGVRSYFSETSKELRDFRAKFRQKLRSEYPNEEETPEPGTSALYAYDAVRAVSRTLETNSTNLLQGILSSNFMGLSGEIQFDDGQLANRTTFQIVNVVGKSYKQLGIWSPGSTHLWGPVIWPGDSVEVPRGWAIPTLEQPLRIAVPNGSIFNVFVKVDYDETGKPMFSGFSISVFELAVKRLHYNLPYEFHVYDGTYDELVDQVYLKKFDAVVGDTTALPNRSDHVDFTQPYLESGLAMLVPVKDSSHKEWLFLKPFTKTMWSMTVAIFFYTGLVVWFLEHRRNPEFRGLKRQQFGTVFWFTSSTLFFAHRERLHSNFTRIVVVIWLLVVFILTSSYTASLTSLLTVRRLEPKVNDTEYLRRNHMPIGCDNNSFGQKYLKEVLHFEQGNIVSINAKEHDYSEALKSGKIAAAFLEIPYLRIFLDKFSKGFTALEPTYRVGGFGFVFPKGSPLTNDMSRAILELSEDGKLRELENQMLPRSSKCSTSTNDVNQENESLSLENFWVLFLITGGTSTVILLVFLAQLYREFRHSLEGEREHVPPSDESVWQKATTLAKPGDQGQLSGHYHSASSANFEEWCSIELEPVSEENTPQHPQGSPA